jgi:hypothetical protein
MEMQERIQAEMEEEQRDRKARKGMPNTMRTLTCVADLNDSDLLRANPNHVGGGWNDDEGASVEVNESDEERDNVEALIAGMERATVTD